MNARIINTDADIRMLDARQTANYMGIGVGNARVICEEIGALKRIGRRVLFDKVVIDKYLDELEAR